MVKLKRWLDENYPKIWIKLSLCFFANRKKYENVSLSIEWVHIVRVSEFRYLGVNLDENLTWKSQIAHV